MKTKLPKLLILAQFVLLTLGSASTPLWAAAVSQNEFWVSAVANGSGPHAGTIADPFDGSTRVLFDALFYPPGPTQLPANCTVHLLGGTFLTAGGSAGGFILKTGQKIRGSGIDITTVKLDYASPGCVMQNVVLTDTGIEISDLTVDANAQNLGGNNTYDGIILNGSGSSAIRRVKVQGLAHGAQATETFGILANDQGIADRVVIEDCVMMPPVYGAVCTPICVGGSARVSGNWIYGTNTTQVQAIGIGNTINTLVSGNHVLNAESAIRTEVGNTNLMVVNNSFRNVTVGVELTANPAGLVNQNLYFAGNTFEMAYQANNYCIAFSQTAGGPLFINEKIIGNTIKAYGDVGPLTYAFSSDATTNLIIADNSIDNRFLWNFAGCTNVILHDNVDLLGNFLSSTNQIELPNSLTRKSVTTLFYNVQNADRYIGVALSGAAVVLPPPSGMPGKEFIIADETGSGPVRISAPSGGINGQSMITVSGGYTSKTVTTDGNTWFAR